MTFAPPPPRIICTKHGFGHDGYCPMCAGDDYKKLHDKISTLTAELEKAKHRLMHAEDLLIDSLHILNKSTWVTRIDELGFSGHKPSEMTNRDYWLCICTAMDEYAKQQAVEFVEKFLIWTENNLWTWFASDKIWIQKQDYMNGKTHSEIYQLFLKDQQK